MMRALAILVLLTASAAAAPPVAELRLSPPEVPFYEPARLTLVVEVDEGATLDLPRLSAPGDAYEVEEGAYTADAVGEDRRRIAQTYLIDPIDTGTYVFSGLAAEVDGAPVPFPAVALRVREPTPEEQEAVEQFISITGPEALDTAPGPAWWMVALAAVPVLLAAGALALYFWRRQQEALPVAPPWDLARDRLQTLARRKLPEAGDFETYYVDLSAILRYYIEDRFHVHAPEQTTPEFLDAAARSGRLSETQQQALAGFLRLSDRVKFAQFAPTLEQTSESFDVVAAFIDETVPQEAPATPVEQAA